jgi:hypothetical protein
MSTNCDKCGVKNPADIHTCGAGVQPAFDHNESLESRLAAPVHGPSLTDLSGAIEYADARWSGVDVPIEWARHFADAIGKLYTTPPAAPVQQEREILRAAQSEAVMPLIGPLLDAWEGGSDFLNEYPELDKQLRRIHRAMENATLPAAQRQWVGLTDDEWQDLSDRYGLLIFGDFKHEIEDKLKEKNT